MTAEPGRGSGPRRRVALVAWVAFVAAVGPAALALGALASSALLLGGCPQRAATAPRAAASSSSTSRLPADAVVVGEARGIAGAQRLFAHMARVVDREGGLAPGAVDRLAQALGADPLGSLWVTAAGVDDERPVALALRPSGEVVLDVPLASPSRFRFALDAVAGREGWAVEEAAWARAGLLVLRGPGGEALLLARVDDDGALLWPQPIDALAGAALIARLGEPGTSLPADLRRPLPPPGGWPTTDVALWALPGAARWLEDGELAAFLPPGFLARLTWLGAWTTSDGFALQALFSREGPIPDGAGAAGACALPPGALVRGRVPVELLPALDPADPSRLAGVLHVALYPHPPEVPLVGDDPFSIAAWVAVGRPAGADAAAALVASFTEAGAAARVERRVWEGVEGVRVVPSPAAPWRVLDLVSDDERFVLASGEPAGWPAVLASGPCPPEAPGAHLEIDAVALAARLGRPPAVPEAESAPPAALRRLLFRALGGLSSVQVDLVPGPGVWRLGLEASLVRSSGGHP